MTARGKQVWEAMQQLGSMSEVGRQLGIGPEAVRRHLIAYQSTAEGRQSPPSEAATLSQRMDRIEAQLDRIERLLREALSRPTVVVSGLSDRRIEDGGEGRKHQQRRLARSVA